MRKKHIAIEILPRLLWFIQGAVLFFTHNPFRQTPSLVETPTLVFVGAVFIISGLFLLTWTLRHVTKALITKKLITDGPYKYSRHPMYVSIYLLLIGLGILFFSASWFVILVLFLPLWYFDCLLEEQQMTDLHGQKYEDYKKKTGMFFLITRR